MTKAAKQARAEMAAKVRAAREAMEFPRVTCAAEYKGPVYMLALGLAREAVAKGLSFGSSRSRNDPGHVVDLVLKDAYEGYWQEKYGSPKP